MFAFQIFFQTGLLSIFIRKQTFPNTIYVSFHLFFYPFILFLSTAHFFITQHLHVWCHWHRQVSAKPTARRRVSKSTDWIYPRLNFFILTECVIVCFFYELCNFFINFVEFSIIDSRGWGLPVDCLSYFLFLPFEVHYVITDYVVLHAYLIF